MPGKDGTGPLGHGSVGSAAAGMRRGRGRMRDNLPPEADGCCICQQCGEKLPHQQGIPCSSVTCPKCGIIMVRNQ